MQQPAPETSTTSERAIPDSVNDKIDDAYEQVGFLVVLVAAAFFAGYLCALVGDVRSVTATPCARSTTSAHPNLHLTTSSSSKPAA